jgi:ParB family chromosome partitioning protein
MSSSLALFRLPDGKTVAEFKDFKARHTMTSPEWFTPSSFVNAARDVMGGIDLDPGSCAEANEIVKARRFITKEQDGLAQVWDAARLFINPPGGRGLVTAFWQKLMRTRSEGFQAVWIGYSLEQLQTLQSHNAVTPLNFSMCVPNRRIQFVAPSGRKAGSPTHANYITYIGDNKEAFYDVFSEFGQVVIR